MSRDLSLPFHTWQDLVFTSLCIITKRYFFILYFILFFDGGTEVQTQGLILARQVYLSHTLVLLL
jgi:hypothetical protein